MYTYLQLFSLYKPDTTEFLITLFLAIFLQKCVLP